MPRTPVTHKSAPPELLTGFWGQERKGKETARGEGKRSKKEKEGRNGKWDKGREKEGKEKRKKGKEREEFCAFAIFP